MLQTLLHLGMIAYNNMIARATAAQFQAIMKTPIIPQLVALLSSPVEGIQEQAVWILDNISVDGDKLRVKALEAGALQELTKVSMQINLPYYESFVLLIGFEEASHQTRGHRCR
jgi:hypothetical protein